MFRLKNRKNFQRSLKSEPLESRSMLAVLSGVVFYDASENGARDPGELGIPGIVIRLENQSSGATQSTLTDDGGNYIFDDLPAGTYQITKQSASATEDDFSTAELSNIFVTADETRGGNDFTEQPLLARYTGLSWFFAIAEPPHDILRETIAISESTAGDAELAATIRAGAGGVPLNIAPIAFADTFATVLNVGLNVGPDEGLLANDTDADGDTLTAALVGQPSNGTALVNLDGSFTYTANTDFLGEDSFTYQASDGVATSNTARVTITVDDGINEAPSATDESFDVESNLRFVILEEQGVLANDTDVEGDTLTAVLVDPPANGILTLDPDGSFAYTPNVNFFGEDSFTYRADDGDLTSNVATVVFDVNPENELFGTAVAGDFEDFDNLGIRTDLVPGAPAITSTHVDGDVDYSQHSNPPTYGDHHGFDSAGVDVNPGVTPRVTGIYSEPQPEEDLIHNLEHGHVWISYDPELISDEDLEALEQFVRDGSPNANGGGVGVILTPRPENDDAIALASWARLQTLDEFNPFEIRAFVDQNRGKAPEGFITP